MSNPGRQLDEMKYTLSDLWNRALRTGDYECLDSIRRALREENNRSEYMERTDKLRGVEVD